MRVQPIVDAEGRVTGAVEVFSDNPSKLAALETPAEMERLALLDPLTAVGNRRYTERALGEHHTGSTAPARRSQLYLDLDHFKAINGTYGHDAGAAVLRVVSQTIVNNLRSFDFLGRWGGEEFIAILTVVDVQRARMIAERRRVLVQSCQIDRRGREIRPTISIGMAVIRPGRQ